MLVNGLRRLLRILTGGRAVPLLSLLLLGAIVGVACHGGGAPPEAEEPQGAPGDRVFEMGLSSFPGEPTEEAYKQTFKLAGENGELILIERAPPWAEFVPGSAISQDTVATTRDEKRLAEENGLKLFVAVDPTDPADRGRLVDLPADLEGATFADPDIRLAFIAYAKFLALNLKPEYMALGTEVNLYFARNPDDFPNFLSLYFEAYDAVKSLSPSTLIFPTFQLEDLAGELPTDQERVTRWYLIQQFEPKLDVLAVSTYPSFAFDSPSDMPEYYYKQLKAATSKPIAIAEMGYSSGEGRHGINRGTEAEQETFLWRVLREANSLQMAFVIWFASSDPEYATEPPFDLIRHIGLRRSDGTEKPAWEAWAYYAAKDLEVTRPFQAAGG
jgi:hypothetical protein